MFYLNAKQCFLLRTARLKEWEKIKSMLQTFSAGKAELVVTNLTCQCCNLVSSTSATVKLSLTGLKEEKDFSLAFLLHTENVFFLHLVAMCSDIFTVVMVRFNGRIA